MEPFLMIETLRTAKYLVAKYIPDLRRYEPRNIGVIIWSPEGVEARFFAEKENQPGVIDGRSVPSFVTNLSAYKQWVQYWRSEIQKSETRPVLGGEPVAQDSPKFTEALKTANRGNFFLTDGGFLLDKISSDQLPHLADHLFTTLVDTNALEDAPDLTLDQVCDELLQASKLAGNPHFHNRYQIRCPVAGEEEEFTFSHAYKNGILERLYQRVPIPKRKRLSLKNIHDAAWMFEKVIDAKIIARAKGAALVYINEDQQQDSDVESALKVLGLVTNVINLHDRGTALEEFQQLAFRSVG
jgi:hypothetical protein